jgi:hypothetical protein
MFLKVLACEIAVRELQYAAARSNNLVDLEFLTQGHHDTPASGRQEIQQRIDALPSGKYEALVLGYALCSNILVGIKAKDTRLIIPRAHDCITFLLGSNARYQERFSQRPGTYYYSSGWLECATRRGAKGSNWGGAALPANSMLTLQPNYQEWVKKYGEDQAKYLLEEMSRWTEAYSHGCLIDFDFLEHLKLPEQVHQICADKGWSFERVQGDLNLFRKMVDGPWMESEFLTVNPGQTVVATFDDRIITAKD